MTVSGGGTSMLLPSQYVTSHDASHGNFAPPQVIGSFLIIFLIVPILIEEFKVVKGTYLD